MFFNIHILMQNSNYFNKILMFFGLFYTSLSKYFE